MCLLLFFPLALNELKDVRVRHFQRLHLGCATRLATALDHARDRIVNAHEGQRTRGSAATRQLLTTAANGRQVGASTATELEHLASLAASRMMSSMLSSNALDEACGTLRILVWVLWLLDFAGISIVVVGALVPVTPYFGTNQH